jgi:hypothetical protein
MTTLAIVSLLAAAWPWGPTGAELADVLFAYGAVLVIIAMVARDIVSSRAGDRPPPSGPER